ncbi:ribosomal L15-domain-containing protein, partial [Lactifluus subvellereus]
KYIGELYKKKQSDVLPVLLLCWGYRQLNAIHRALRASRPDKARRLVYKAKQRYVIYCVRVGRGISPAARSPPSSTPPTSPPPTPRPATPVPVAPNDSGSAGLRDMSPLTGTKRCSRHGNPYTSSPRGSEQHETEKGSPPYLYLPHNTVYCTPTRPGYSPFTSARP